MSYEEARETIRPRGSYLDITGMQRLYYQAAGVHKSIVKSCILSPLKVCQIFVKRDDTETNFELRLFFHNLNQQLKLFAILFSLAKFKFNFLALVFSLT